MKKIFYFLTRNKVFVYKKIVKRSKKYIFFKNNKRKYPIHYFFYSFFFNKLSAKYNIWIEGQVGDNLKVYHQNIVVNQYATLGDNIKLHGNNCIGNNNDNEPEKCPQIGNNVEIGFGASIIGNVTLADGIIVGANSLVNKSFFEKNIVIAGSPAKRIK